MLKMTDNENIDEFSGKLSGILIKFKNIGSTLEDKVIVRKLLNSVPKKFIQIVAAIEQYSEIDTMPIEEAVGRLKAYERGSKDKKMKMKAKVNFYFLARILEAIMGKKSRKETTAVAKVGHFAYECPNLNDKEDETNLVQAHEDEPTLL
ncbi:hypothetical protein E3N88_38391 [Mikania micrantha]|uniref:Zinc finger, CCHC-type n=1 Tax=Mikania micrantha TaxID=192012 RepID=A0A5N6LTW6_9ASTR|nr:hypothetical protein E3N88_38391 [Mikania micrantha]